MGSPTRSTAQPVHGLLSCSVEWSCSVADYRGDCHSHATHLDDNRDIDSPIRARILEWAPSSLHLRHFASHQSRFDLFQASEVIRKSQVLTGDSRRDGSTDSHTSTHPLMKRTSASPLASSSMEKRQKHTFQPAELNASMHKVSSLELWQLRAERANAAQDNDKLWKSLISSILIAVTRILADTELKDKFVPAQNHRQAEAIVNRFSPEDLKEWKDGVMKGVIQGIWEGLLDHRCLIAPDKIPLSRNANMSPHQLAVFRAWQQPYVGKHHELLLNNINSMKRTEPYSNSVAIIQSSGSGKSRMVREQANLVFTLPFNLRLRVESQALAYPPPDDVVRNYMDIAVRDLEAGLIRYLKFLTNTFRAVKDEISLLGQQDTYRSLAQAWREHLEKDQIRENLYHKVIEGCIELVGDNRRAISTEARDALVGLLRDMALSCNSTEDFTKNSNVKLMIYFDDGDVLVNKQVQKDNMDMYDVLCSCFDYFIDYPVFVIFLSTNSSLSRMALPVPYARSARACQNADALQAPITETPFDCSPELPITPSDYKLSDLSRIDTLAFFGRPLFWALLSANQGRRISIMDLARSKLLGQSKIRGTYTYYRPEAQMAVLDVLLNLEFEPRRAAARDREALLVASHLRTAYSVPADRSYLRSGYPSEPLLAEAAALQMHEFQRNYPDVNRNIMTEILELVFVQGLLDIGQRGEVVWRLLVMTAYMRAVVKDHSDSALNFSQGCKLITLIEEFFADDYAREILNSLPDNIKTNTKFSSAFQNAVVRFTHFGRMADDTGTSTHVCLAAFVRGMAIICWTSQEGVDIVLPILLDPSQKLTEANISGVLVQIKRRKSAGSIASYAIDQQKYNFFPKPRRRPRHRTSVCYDSRRVGGPASNSFNSGHGWESPPGFAPMFICWATASHA